MRVRFLCSLALSLAMATTLGACILFGSESRDIAVQTALFGSADVTSAVAASCDGHIFALSCP